MPDLTGTVIGQGRYLIESKCASGGQGSVYRGRHLTLDIPVAIKVLAQDEAHAAVAQKRFEREAKRAAKLRHANIVVIHDYGYEKGLYYIVEDYVEGTNLRDRLSRAGGALPLAEALTYVEEIGAALQHAHEQGTIHRDIKPGNILLSAATGQALLCDFGLARLLRDESLEVTTEAHALLGTPAYMSPEQCLALQLDARTDVYSFGLVVYEMLVGQHPLLRDSDNCDAICHKQVHEMPPAPSTVNRALPVALDAVLLMALAKNPSKRYPTVAAFVQGLQQVLSQPHAAPKPASARRPPPAPKPAPARRATPRRRPRLAGYLLSMFVFIGAVGFWRGWFSLSSLSPSEERASQRLATPAVQAKPPLTGITQPSEPVCSQPGVCLSSPTMNQRVYGTLSIEGTAAINDFQFYKVEIASGEEPSDWSVVHDIHATMVEQGLLESLDSTVLANGVYWLRVVVVDKTGNFPAPAAVRIEVRN